VANVAFEQNGGGNILINNLDAGIPHPFHLHGNPFWLLGRGKGNLTAKAAESLSVNTKNPLRRDTLLIDVGEWALLRGSPSALANPDRSMLLSNTDVEEVS
jgi:FtsP/CotA-like multicopper oxidase with cupredoxin domain